MIIYEDKGTRTVADEKQTISITDIISEGPIYGLVEGPASVYLNNEPQFDNPYVPRSISKGASIITLRNGGTTADVLLTGTNISTNEDFEILKANFCSKSVCRRGTSTDAFGSCNFL